MSANEFFITLTDVFIGLLTIVTSFSVQFKYSLLYDSSASHSSVATNLVPISIPSAPYLKTFSASCLSKMPPPTMRGQFSIFASSAFISATIL